VLGTYSSGENGVVDAVNVADYRHIIKRLIPNISANKSANSLIHI